MFVKITMAMLMGAIFQKFTGMEVKYEIAISMYANVNNGERPDFGETAKTTTRRVLQGYFDFVDILYLQ